MSSTLIDLKSYKGFVLCRNDSSVESRRLKLYCHVKDIDLIHVDKSEPPPINYVPFGDVGWCELALGSTITPDYYPIWLKPHFNRNIWKSDKWPMQRVFIKPSDTYKRFTGFVTTGTYKKKKKPPFICSDIVHFVNEWRYYISNGTVKAKEWYWGDDENIPEAPNVNISIPSNYYGAVDFGITRNNEFMLVEAQHPFSCGWYGDGVNDHIYFQWMVDGWEYMQKEFCK